MKNRIEIGKEYLFENETWNVLKYVTSSKVMIENIESKIVKVAFTKELKRTEVVSQNTPLETISDEDWNEAQSRYAILSQLNDQIDSTDQNIHSIIKKVADQNDISSRTLYRWKKKFDNTGLISALAPKRSSGGRGKGRIDKELEREILSVINEYHFKSLKPIVSKSYEELLKRCNKKGIKPPALTTFSSRINLITKTEVIEKRLGKSAAKQLTNPVPGSYPSVQSPLEVVQIDHTPLDLIVVDDHRRPIGRPWLTLGIDIYSRMVTGLYISFESPGMLSTGICIANSILPKDPIINKFNLSSDWPIQGRIGNIHTDNAAEFKSDTITKACQEYGINLLYRALGNTHWGGHIERLLGNFMKELHHIPGTTFSNVQERGDYNSEKEAILTLPELEEWLHTFIADVYHQSPHSGIGMSPIMKYYEGIFGDDESLPTGLGVFEYDPFKVKVDFLPSIERTIQRTGIQIDHLRYYGDILQPYIYMSSSSENLHKPKSRYPEKFIFKRDPRDLSCIWFLEPKQNQYFPIYFADKTRPSISLGEHRMIIKSLRKKSKVDKITEQKIFDALERMDTIIDKAKSEKFKAKKAERSKKVKDYLGQISTKRNQDTSKGPDFNNVKPLNYSNEL